MGAEPWAFDDVLGLNGGVLAFTDLDGLGVLEHRPAAPSSAPAFFKSASTPLFKRSTMPSFQPTGLLMSSSAGPGMEMPMWPSLLACLARLWKVWAA